MAEANRKKAASEPEPSRRVVLRRAQVIVITDPGAIPAEILKQIGGHVAEAWLVVGEHEGRDKRQAIEAAVGKPGTPDATPGVYRAPTVSAWKGAREYVQPAHPKVEARDVD